MPKVYVINDPALNAFATGHNPNSASVLQTTGLLEVLNDAELEGGWRMKKQGHKATTYSRIVGSFCACSSHRHHVDIILRLSWFGRR